jgi:hypothetical protein
MPVRVQAASGVAVYGGTISIAINESVGTADYLIKKSGAKYTYSSAKSSIAKVDKKGKVTGVKAGTTKIKVTEKYKGKTRTDSVKFTIKKASLSNSEICYIELGDYGDYNFKNSISYMNSKASYKIYSNDTSKIKISTKGKITYVNAVNGDKTTFTVKETYKGKTRTLGKIQVIFEDYDDDDDDDDDEDYDEDYDEDDDDDDDDYDDDYEVDDEDE